MSKPKIFWAKSDSPKMIAAFQQAQATFKFFWRELSWEYRRVIPALNVACVKIAFSQVLPGDEEPTVEHIWVNNISFDGDTIYGTVINTPNQLTNIQNGEAVEVPLAQLSDWLFLLRDKPYGGFTIQAMRAAMNKRERTAHDKAWGIDFGDPDKILLVYEQDEKPENLEEHPMSKNMGDSLVTFLKENPEEVSAADELGYTMLHREAIAGNKTSVETLLQYGAKADATTHHGKTALDFAKQMDWPVIVALLEK